LAYGVGGVLYNLRTAQWSLLSGFDPYSISGNNISGWQDDLGPTIYNLANGNYFNPVRGKAQFPSFGFMNSINDYSNGIAVGGYTYVIQGRTSIAYYAYSVPEASTWLLVALGLAFFGIVDDQCRLLKLIHRPIYCVWRATKEER
jgi:hypothetical protein